MYKSILVPLDGSKHAEWALPTAITIARATGARISLITVQVPVAVMAAGLSILDSPSLDARDIDMSDYLEKMAERVAGRGVKAESLGMVEPTSLVLASVGSEIAHRAGIMGADLIVMATHARAAMSRMFMGSVARDTVRSSKVPVLMVKPHATEPPPHLWEGHLFRNVLVPLAGPPFSEQVLEDAIELGDLTGANFTLLTVINPPHVYGVPVEPALLPVDEVELGEQQRNAQSYLDRIAAAMTKRGQSVTTRIVFNDDTAVAILSAARDIDADLIAMTTHARNELASLFLGNVARNVVKGTPVPVLLYRPPS